MAIQMHQVSVQITGYVDAAFPDFVSCALHYAHDHTWEFVEKVPVVTLATLTDESRYPQPGTIRCHVLSRSIDPTGFTVARIDTRNPDGVESREGRTIFEVFTEELVAGDASPPHEAAKARPANDAELAPATRALQLMRER